nr:transposase [Paenibacillus alginolyticus]
MKTGDGCKIAATILSEIGEIHRFNHAKKLAAFAGIDLSVYSSRKFTTTSNRITKRGSKKPHKTPCTSPSYAVLKSLSVRD